MMTVTHNSVSLRAYLKSTHSDFYLMFLIKLSAVTCLTVQHPVGSLTVPMQIKMLDPGQQGSVCLGVRFAFTERPHWKTPKMNVVLNSSAISAPSTRTWAGIMEGRTWSIP